MSVLLTEENIAGVVLVIDGKTWTPQRFAGEALIASDEEGYLISCDRRELVRMGKGAAANLWTLPGRTVARAPNPDATVMTEPAETQAGGA